MLHERTPSGVRFVFGYDGGRPSGLEQAGRQPDMSQGFGNELPRAHGNTSPRPRTRYLFVIDSAGFMVARLFLESREQVAEFDAGTEEVAQMIAHLRADGDAGDPQWDRALAGHSAAERAQARVYELEI
jgi:hypothetical protein